MRMKSIVLLSCLCVASMLVGNAWAGQVVTDADRSWAKQILAQEKVVGAAPTPGALAVLYFVNKTDRADWAPLQKGLTLMLITDLSAVPGIQVVERAKLQALLEELDLGASGLVAEESAPRVGKMLGVSNVIGGDLLSGTGGKLRVGPRALALPGGGVSPMPPAEGDLSEFFRMEKEILFTILDSILNTPVTDAQRARLSAPMTTSFRALMLLFDGLMYSDRREYDKASACYEAALKEDPQLHPASEFLSELNRLGLVPNPLSDKKAFLKSVKNRTSLTDSVTPPDSLHRERTPAEVGYER